MQTGSNSLLESLASTYRVRSGKQQEISAITGKFLGYAI